MRFAIAFLLAFSVGAACRFFDIPVPSPPAISGVVLIAAITLGYLTVDKVMTRPGRDKDHTATTSSTTAK